MVVCVAPTAHASAQEPLQQVRDLYAAAAYEATLTAVSRLNDSEPKPELEQYRILSLVALGRTADAEQGIEQLLMQHPLYHPLAADTPPRIRELFTTVRRRLAPSVAQRIYLDGKRAFDRKDRAAAVRLFEELARVTDDRDLRDDPVIGQMRLLAGGFLALSQALPSNAADDRVGTITPVSPIELPQSVAPTTAASLPVAIREDLPAWTPSDEFSGSIAFRGAVRVSITASGTVDSAELVQSIHPAYDPVLLKAARTWKYQPGRINGQPVPSERIVSVVLKPKPRQ
jgi:TonB family protein